jgi:hypothetical protein
MLMSISCNDNASAPELTEDASLFERIHAEQQRNWRP